MEFLCQFCTKNLGLLKFEIDIDILGCGLVFNVLSSQVIQIDIYGKYIDINFNKLEI